MIKCDFQNFNSLTSKDYNLDKIKDKFLSENKMAGWYNLDIDTTDIKKCAKEIREKADVFVVIGIGGSYLGAKAIIDALTPYFNKDKVEIIFVGTDLSTDYLLDVLEYIDNKSVYINVISKSGTTLEPMLAFDIFLQYMQDKYTDYNKRIIVTTDKAKGKLLLLAQEYKFKCFEVPSNIGGRYSVLTPVGLLPIAVANIDIDKIINGSKYAKDHLDDCYKYTVIRDLLYKSNKFVESIDIYEPKLYYFTEWLKQLFAESQGKNSKGILPISTVNTRDLHSLGQFFQEGPSISFSTVIFSNSTRDIYIKEYDKTLNEINKIAMKSVAVAHLNKIHTNIIELDTIDEENMGYLIFFFEMSAMLGSYLLNVNYYDQPGVNQYKDIMKCKLDIKSD